MLAYEVRDAVFLTYMRIPGTVREVIRYNGDVYGYIVETEYHGTDLFRVDEVEDYEAEKWEGE